MRKKTSNKIARHHAVNDLIARAFISAGIPVSKEPFRLNRRDGKRPDGLTLIPRHGGKPVCWEWDVTVVSTLADSYFYTSAHTAGGATDLAASRKEVKYADLPSSYTFQPLAFVTLGPLSSFTMVFFDKTWLSVISIRNVRDCLSFFSVCLSLFKGSTLF